MVHAGGELGLRGELRGDPLVCGRGELGFGERPGKRVGGNHLPLERRLRLAGALPLHPQAADGLCQLVLPKGCRAGRPWRGVAGGQLEQPVELALPGLRLCVQAFGLDGQICDVRDRVVQLRPLLAHELQPRVKCRDVRERECVPHWGRTMCKQSQELFLPHVFLRCAHLP